MINCVTRANRRNVQSNSNSIVFLGIDLFEDQATIVQPKRLNICLAIDCSGSMQGTKFEQAKQSASILARSLAPNDLISIVTFEARVKVALSPTPAAELEKIENVIQSIKLGSATFLYSALKQAHKVVSKNSQSSGQPEADGGSLELQPDYSRCRVVAEVAGSPSRIARLKIAEFSDNRYIFG